MPIIRNRFSNLRAGGPRQFTELRDRIILTARTADERVNVARELSQTGFATVELDTANVVIAEPEERIEDILGRFSQIRENTDNIEQAINEIRQSRQEGETFFESTQATLDATRQMLDQIQQIAGVATSDFIFTYADFGPENLRLSPDEMPFVPEGEAQEEENNLGDINEIKNLPEAWEMTRGEGTVVAIFDTGYARELISEDRIIETFHHNSVDSVYAPGEGHGSMTAGAAAANKDDFENVPFNGAAPDVDVILVRITDNEGSIRGDVITEAWDWLRNLELDQPIITNHSYGTPICSGRPRTNFCNDPLANVIEVANRREDITSIYAAGNEANTCGHRPSGITNAITGHNSLESIIAVGALLSNGREAQRYSSHGRGDCSPIADPKPNFSNQIPVFTYYGVQGGWEIKDMSTGIFGSSGGTSHAAPHSAGMVALLQSRALDVRDEPMSTEEIKQIIQDTAESPHISHINALGITSPKGYDARFGFGEINIIEALNQV